MTTSKQTSPTFHDFFRSCQGNGNWGIGELGIGISEIPNGVLKAYASHRIARLKIHFSPWHQSSRSLSFMQTSLLRPGIGNSGIGILDLGIRELESGIGNWEFGSSGIYLLYAKHNHGTRCILQKMYSTYKHTHTHANNHVTKTSGATLSTANWEHTRTKNKCKRTHTRKHTSKKTYTRTHTHTWFPRPRIDKQHATSQINIQGGRHEP